MDPEQGLGGTSPAIDMLAGAFFLAWAAVGWYAYLINEPLRRSLWAGADPGPALLALITLWILTLGGGAIAIKGVYRALSGEKASRFAALPALDTHILPVSFTASLLLAVLLMRPVGFPVVGFVFSLVWLYILSAGRTVSLRYGLIAVVLAAIMTAAVYLIFARVLLVPLPR